MGNCQSALVWLALRSCSQAAISCDHDLLKEFGDSRILQKPYTEGDLVDKIAAALN